MIFQAKQMIKLKMLFTLLSWIQQTLSAKKNIDSEVVIGLPVAMLTVESMYALMNLFMIL